MAKRPKTKATIRKRPVKKSTAPAPVEPVVEPTAPVAATLSASADVSSPEPKPKNEITCYESRDEESGMFEISGIRSTRLPNMKLHWEVPADKVKNFDNHHHVLRGRVKKIK